MLLLDHSEADVDASGYFDVDVGAGRRGGQRLIGLGAVKSRALEHEGLDHYGVAMLHPEGNEFDINS